MSASLLQKSAIKPDPDLEVPLDDYITADEARLVQKGDFNALQRWRYNACFKSSSFPDPSYELLDTEEYLREIVQEEMAIKNSPATAETEKRLQHLGAEYWRYSQTWWCCRSNMVYMQLRAFLLWRSQTEWYMHPHLVEMCAGLQGCCARGCGCCTNRKIDPSRTLGVGHCTVECVCCQRTRGFELTSDDKKKFKGMFKMDYPFDSCRLIKMMLVSVWGICADDSVGTCDIIAAPPSYKQSEGKKMGLRKWFQQKIWN
ncbi:unnamed protein product [Penicillium salamii]|uniref:Uncharacterized protein n=1 Tax=Penicillium salamii TaxID=1612424 RepID=A0A9W4NNV2_9EURO|nr:unnamed protein product [Penicillium salamii]CAG8363666.1 unnamed protein product [Penicillium salamii]CAG8388213.1 unnamed protein product [Penicillium salamii]CAG8392706.1 unnamed protein product [Penicillium salamii]